MTPEERLATMGITLPAPPAAVAAYVPWVRTGNLVVTSGQLPWRDGAIAVAGKLGDGVTDEQGYHAARQCAINAVAQLKDAVGELSRIRRIVRIEGYVHAAAGYRGHPQVLNGASESVFKKSKSLVRESLLAPENGRESLPAARRGRSPVPNGGEMGISPQLFRHALS